MDTLEENFLSLHGKRKTWSKKSKLHYKKAIQTEGFFPLFFPYIFIFSIFNDFTPDFKINFLKTRLYIAGDLRFLKKIFLIKD